MSPTTTGRPWNPVEKVLEAGWVQDYTSKWDESPSSHSAESGSTTDEKHLCVTTVQHPSEQTQDSSVHSDLLWPYETRPWPEGVSGTYDRRVKESSSHLLLLGLRVFRNIDVYRENQLLCATEPCSGTVSDKRPGKGTGRWQLKR